MKPSDYLRFYAERLDTVEVDSTFYACFQGYGPTVAEFLETLGSRMVLERYPRQSQLRGCKRRYFHRTIEPPCFVLSSRRFARRELLPLQRLLGLRVVVHRVRIAHPPIVVFLAVLRQVLLHIPPLVNLATLHFHLFSEYMFHTGA
jgi:hypothetical protein